MFNSAWPALCWVSLEDCKEHCSRGSLLSCQCQVYEQSPVPGLNLQSGVCDSCRYLEYYKSPMEQMHERCENYPPCDYLSDQVGFALAYNRFFGRYWPWEGPSAPLAWNTPNPAGERSCAWEGGKESIWTGIFFCCVPTSWNTKAGIIPLAELPLAFFLSSIKSLFRHLLWYFELHQKTRSYFLPPESPAHNMWKIGISFKKTTACFRNITRSLIFFYKTQEDYGRRMSQCV